MKTLGLLLCIVLLSTHATFSQTNNQPMKDAIEEVITNFKEAIAERDVAALENVLHADFRVMANRFRGGKGTTLLSRDAYLGMMKAEKIGGTNYDMSFEQVLIYDHSAAAEVNFRGADGGMHVFLLLVQDDNDNWKIISDLPITTTP